MTGEPNKHLDSSLVHSPFTFIVKKTSSNKLKAKGRNNK